MKFGCFMSSFPQQELKRLFAYKNCSKFPLENSAVLKCFRAYDWSYSMTNPKYQNCLANSLSTKPDQMLLLINLKPVTIPMLILKKHTDDNEKMFKGGAF